MAQAGHCSWGCWSSSGGFFGSVPQVHRRVRLLVKSLGQGFALRLAYGFVWAGFQGKVGFVRKGFWLSSGRLVKSVSGCKGVSWVRSGFQSQRRLVGQGIGQS